MSSLFNFLSLSLIGLLVHALPAVKSKATGTYKNKSVVIFSVKGDWACANENSGDCGYGNIETEIKDSKNKIIKRCETFFEASKPVDSVCGLKLENLKKSD